MLLTKGARSDPSIYPPQSGARPKTSRASRLEPRNEVVARASALRRRQRLRLRPPPLRPPPPSPVAALAGNGAPPVVGWKGYAFGLRGESLAGLRLDAPTTTPTPYHGGAVLHERRGPQLPRLTCFASKLQ